MDHYSGGSDSLLRPIAQPAEGSLPLAGTWKRCQAVIVVLLRQIMHNQPTRSHGQATFDGGYYTPVDCDRRIQYLRLAFEPTTRTLRTHCGDSVDHSQPTNHHTPPAPPPAPLAKLMGVSTLASGRCDETRVDNSGDSTLVVKSSNEGGYRGATPPTLPYPPYLGDADWGFGVHPNLSRKGR
jgi:hypothetical protein